jgi:hypothetical protein
MGTSDEAGSSRESVKRKTPDRTSYGILDESSDLEMDVYYEAANANDTETATNRTIGDSDRESKRSRNYEPATVPAAVIAASSRTENTSSITSVLQTWIAGEESMPTSFVLHSQSGCVSLASWIRAPEATCESVVAEQQRVCAALAQTLSNYQRWRAEAGAVFDPSFPSAFDRRLALLLEPFVRRGEWYGAYARNDTLYTGILENTLRADELWSKFATLSSLNKGSDAHEALRRAADAEELLDRTRSAAELSEELCSTVRSSRQLAPCSAARSAEWEDGFAAVTAELASPAVHARCVEQWKQLLELRASLHAARKRLVENDESLFHADSGAFELFGVALDPSALTELIDSVASLHERTMSYLREPSPDTSITALEARVVQCSRALQEQLRRLEVRVHSALSAARMRALFGPRLLHADAFAGAASGTIPLQPKRDRICGSCKSGSAAYVTICRFSCPRACSSSRTSSAEALRCTAPPHASGCAVQTHAHASADQRSARTFSSQLVVRLGL